MRHIGDPGEIERIHDWCLSTTLRFVERRRSIGKVMSCNGLSTAEKYGQGLDCHGASQHSPEAHPSWDQRIAE